MLIGITGRAGSGKDTVADILVANHSFVKVAFADPIKRICRDVFRFTEEQLWGPSEARNAEDVRYPRPSGMECLTPRYALQKLGTEWGRDCYQDIWVDIAIRTAYALLSGFPVEYSRDKGLVPLGLWPLKRPQGVVISDVRYPNEVEALHKRKATIWKTTYGTGLTGAAGSHESERYIDDLEVDATIPSVGGLDQLKQTVATVLQWVSTLS